MAVFTDQTGRRISLPQPPQRIISLVPSQTELLYDLGLDKEVTGITKFCVHPDEWFRTKTRVGGTKQLKMEVIHQLQPDLIIANKEENVKEQIEELASHYPVWISDVANLEDACSMIGQIGLITHKEDPAMAIINQVRDSFAILRHQTQNSKRKTIYLIWQEPYMTAGGDTFIHFMLDIAGFENVYAAHNRYPTLSIDELKTENLDLILLSSEPFPFKQKHIDQLKASGVTAEIILVDGEMFSWYGSRLRYAAEYFLKLHVQIKGKR